LWDENGSLKFKLTLQDGKMSDTETNNFKFAIQNGVKINSSLIKVFKSVFVIDGKFNCFDGSKSIQEDYVNDRYCDCSDCSDEPLLTR
jgi:Zn finger protein HypA/HybF involved in hydrogenase expression